MNTFNTKYDPYRPLSNDSTLGFNEYQTTIMGFLSPECTETKESQLVNASLGLAGETGEFVDKIKKWMFHGHDLDLLAVRKELGDIQFYLAEAADALDTRLEDIAKINLEKLAKRYPDGKFNSEHSKEKRDEME